MKLSVLHISDLHIKKDDNEIFSRVDDVSSAHYEHLRNSDACLIIVTGDMAYGGEKKNTAWFINI